MYQSARLRTDFGIAGLATVLVVSLCIPGAARAQGMTLAWDASPDSSVGSYNFYVGTAPGTHNISIQSVPASQTTFAFTPSPGVLYYFAVSSVNTAGAEGPLSSEIAGSVPLLYPLNDRSSAVNVRIVPMSLSAVDPDGGTLRYSHIGLPLGLTLDQLSGAITGTPTAVGTYHVTIMASDGLGTSSQSFEWTVRDATSSETMAPSVVRTALATTPVSITGLISSLSSPQAAGTPVTFTATATGGSGSYQFKWWLWDGSNWTMIRDWNSGTYTWTPTLATSDYRIGIWARDATSRVDSGQLNLSIPYAITTSSSSAASASSSEWLSLGLTGHVASPQLVGTSVTFTATATGGAGSYQFKWWMWDGFSWTMVRDWGSATYTWTPIQPSPYYRIGVWARNASTTADSGQFNLSIPYPINPAGSLSLSLTSDVPLPQTSGSTLTFTATANGGAGSYQFKWWIYDGYTWSSARDWSPGTFTWTPTSANANYRIGIWARDATSTLDSGQFNLSIPVPVTP